MLMPRSAAAAHARSKVSSSIGIVICDAIAGRQGVPVADCIEHSRSAGRNPSLQRFCMAALAGMLAVLVRRLRGIGVEDDAVESSQRYEALAARPADHR